MTASDDSPHRLRSRRDACKLLAAAGLGLAAGRASFAQSDALAAAREALERGEAAVGLERYEALVRLGESLEAEVGLIRAAVRAGELRKAFAHANQTAGERPDATEPAALLAYLLDRTGRTEQALAALAELRAAHPADWLPVAAQAEVLIDRLVPDQAIAAIEQWQARNAAGGAPLPDELRRLLRRASAAAGNDSGAWGSALAARATWVAVGFDAFPSHDAESIVAAGNGVVIDGGAAVLTYVRLAAGAKRLWARNGVGEVREAFVEGSLGGSDLVRLRLDRAYPARWSLAAADVVPPEGVHTCFALAFGAPHSGDAAYPAVTAGTVVLADAGIGGLLKITSRLGRGHDGAPVFDARGHLIGLGLASGGHTIAGREVRPALGPGGLALRVNRVLGDFAETSSNEPSGLRTPPIEELFERLSPAVVQIVATS